MFIHSSSHLHKQSVLLLRPVSFGPLFFCLHAFLAGCGSTNGFKAPSSSHLPSPNGILTRFDVDVKTGKVRIMPGQGGLSRSRAILTGGAVSFFSSDLLSVGGDSGKRLLHIRVVNNTNEAIPGALRLVIGNLANSLPVDGKANTFTTTLAGNGTGSSTDGYGTGATFNVPMGVTGGGSAAPNIFYVSDSAGNKIRKVYADGNVTTFAGSGAAGSVDGTGTAAQFSSPQQLATDAAGNVFVADSGGHKIRRITPSGQVTTIAGTGTAGNANGAGNVATFNTPKGIAVSADGDRIYVTDTVSTSDVRLITYNSGPRDQATSYTVSTVATLLVGSTSSRLALATDSSGTETLFVAHREDNTVKRVDAPSSGAAVLYTIAGTGTAGSADGPGSSATLSTPNGIAAVVLDATTFVLFVSEDTAGAGTGHTIREILYTGNEPQQKGSYQVVTLGGLAGTSGSADGDGSTVRFNAPASLYAIPAAGPSATLLIADSSNNRLRKMQVSSGALKTGFTSATSVTEAVRVANWDQEVPNQTAWTKDLAPATDAAGYAADVQFYVPEGVSGFSFTAYVEADTGLVNLPGINAAYLSTLAGDGKQGYSNGPGKSAQTWQPEQIVAVPPALQSAYTAAGYPVIRAFFTDYGNNRIRYLDGNGHLGTFAGSSSGYADGTGAAAKFITPRGVAIAPDGTLFVAEGGGNRIRRISVGGVVTTVAGSTSGTAGSADGAGNVATFNLPIAVAVDGGGTLYVTDYNTHIVRKVSLTGTDPTVSTSYQVVTIAGLAGTSGSADGTGTSARFRNPVGIVWDTDGRLYVADAFNHTIRVLTRVSGSEQMAVTTLAGSAGVSGAQDGTGNAARFNTPTGVAVDSVHNVYVADFGNHRVCRINPQAVVKTIMGGTTQTSGFVDGYDASPYSPLGRFLGPRHIAVEANGNILVSDENNNSIRLIQRVIRDAQTPTQ